LILGALLLLSSGAADVFAQPAPGKTAVVLGTSGSGVKVRSGPGITHEILGVVSEGKRVDVLSGLQSDGDQTWLQIRTSDGAGNTVRGWAAAMYLVAADRISVAEDGTILGRKLSAKITGYVSGINGVGYYTATGTRVRWGTVSVDPRLIPLGSLLTIDGLDGVFAAEDTGGAVRGAVVDVWFADLASAQRWGSQQRTVQILREGA
jgi:3D (Asp-Asp-Asp) domain-containing protein